MVEFDCDYCDHVFTVKIDDCIIEGVCNYGDDLCSCCGFIYVHDCPNCGCSVEEECTE